MKILVVADFHGNSNAEANLGKLLERGYDCLLMIGDLTNFGPLEAAESLLETVRRHGVPSFAVPGNCDPKQILQLLEKYGVSLHGKCQSLGNMTFVGLGGSNITPFKTPFELTEAEIREELAAVACNISGQWILATHTPPYGTALDIVNSGSHVGSKSIREYVELKQPTVVACGHVHEARGIDVLGNTMMVNPGPISKGLAAEIRINGNTRPEIELLQI
ncbi:MAG: metallophosphoesterase family protein [Candidatus Hadarchaeales archaeon]